MIRLATQADLPAIESIDFAESPSVSSSRKNTMGEIFRTESDRFRDP